MEANSDNKEIKFSHPMANELNELERLKKIAKSNNDIASYKKAQMAIEEIIRQNPVTISSQDWDKMSIEEQMAFIKLKMNESIVLHDQEAYDRWNKQYINLENKKKNTSSEKKDYYQQLLDAVERRRKTTNISEADKKQIVGEIYYNMDYLVAGLKTDTDVMDLLSKIFVDLTHDDFEIKIQNQILADIQDKFGIKDKKTEEPKKEETREKGNLDFELDYLKKKLNIIKQSYTKMVADGRIDDEELAELINQLHDLSKDAEDLFALATTQKEKDLLLFVINNIGAEEKKMISVNNKIEDIDRRFRM